MAALPPGERGGDGSDPTLDPDLLGVYGSPTLDRGVAKDITSVQKWTFKYDALSEPECKGMMYASLDIESQTQERGRRAGWEEGVFEAARGGRE